MAKVTGTSELSNLAGFEKLIHLRDSAYATDMLIASIAHLNFFTLIGDRSFTFQDACAQFCLNSRAFDVMLTLFKSWDLITEENGQFRLTITAKRFLDSRVPGNLVAYFASLKMRSSVSDMLEVLKTGQCVAWRLQQQSAQEQWSTLMKDPLFAESYIEAMDNRGVTFASALAEIWNCRESRSLLDIAGGSGIYTACLLKQNRHLKAEIIEQEPVDKITNSFIIKHGISNRVRVKTQDMFSSPFPTGHDLHLFSHVLHNWDTPQITLLIDKSFQSLASGGQLGVYGAHINLSKDGPIGVAEYSSLMISLYEGKCYSFDEIKYIMQQLGFIEINYINSIANRSLIVGIKK